MHRLSVREGLPLEVDALTALAVRRRLLALQAEMTPRIGFLSGSDALPVVRNLVGSVQVNPGLVLDIQPKTEPGQNWPAALIDLLIDDRVEFGGETPDAEMAPRLVLADVLARLYAVQLDRAISCEGPLAVLVQRHTSRPRLVGRLDVTQWVRRRITNPVEFPQQETLLTVDNDFTRVMAWAAEALAVRSIDPPLAGRLRRIAARLRPGFPEQTTVDPMIAVRQIPTQWRAYGPAWATACAVLRRVSPLHRSGVLEGFNLAIEPWPLLERLLIRSLHAAARQASTGGHPLRAQGHSTHTLLTVDPMTENPRPALTRLAKDRSVEPDGTLWSGEHIIANFEAKYSRADSDAQLRSHIFQAMTAAAALRSPLAVLVYPEASTPVTWTVEGFNGEPLKLAAVGLDMFGYRRGRGDKLRGEMLLELVNPFLNGAALV